VAASFAIPRVPAGVIDQPLRPQFVFVRREPTAEMLDAGVWSAYGEDAAGVWRDRIEASLEQRESSK
jgi:hypothetical protein